MMPHAEVAGAWATLHGPQSNQPFLASHHAVEGNSEITTNVIAVADVEANAVDVQIHGKRIGDEEMDIFQFAAVHPCRFGNQVVEVVMSAVKIFFGSASAVVPGHVDDVDLIEVRGQVTKHQGLELSDGQAVFELIAVIGSRRVPVDFSRSEVAVGQHREHGEVKLGAI